MNYTHPHPDPAHVMRCYRRFLMGQKRVWMAGGKGNKCLRGLIHYRGLVDEYVAAKRLVVTSRRLLADTAVT